MSFYKSNITPPDARGAETAGQTASLLNSDNSAIAHIGPRLLHLATFADMSLTSLSPHFYPPVLETSFSVRRLHGTNGTILSQHDEYTAPTIEASQGACLPQPPPLICVRLLLKPTAAALPAPPGPPQNPSWRGPTPSKGCTVLSTC